MKRNLFALFTAMLCLICFAFTGCTAPSDETPGGTSDPERTYYTVTFDSNGGSPVESREVLAGNPVLRPDPPVLDGYFLNGWYEDEELSDEWHFDTDRVQADMTLYAGWTAEENMQPTEGIEYTLNEAENAYTVTDFTGEDTRIIIPAEYEGLPVTAIQGDYGTGAFARAAVTSVVIPDSMEVIGQNSFANCSALVSVSISANSALRELGNNAFSGCSSLTSFYLPEGATELGDNVFNNCGALEAFTVAEGNAAYRAENGHLIENATNTLIRGGYNSSVPESVTSIAQAAFRNASGITELYIPTSVTQLGNYFIANSSIATILYAGTEAEWNAVEKDEEMWNSFNRDVVVEYNVSPSEPDTGNDVLVVYFSATGNTEGVAEIIAEYMGATLWEIEAADPYTEEDLAYYTGGRADEEQDDPDCRPEIAESVADFEAYDTVFIGHPIWHGIAPRIIQTFLESYDFSDKTVYTFSTSASSSGSGAFNALMREYPQINFVQNLHFTSSQLSSAEGRVEAWLSELGLTGRSA